MLFVTLHVCLEVTQVFLSLLLLGLQVYSLNVFMKLSYNIIFVHHCLVVLLSLDLQLSEELLLFVL